MVCLVVLRFSVSLPVSLLLRSKPPEFAYQLNRPCSYQPASPAWTRSPAHKPWSGDKILPSYSRVSAEANAFQALGRHSVLACRSEQVAASRKQEQRQSFNKAVSLDCLTWSEPGMTVGNRPWQAFRFAGGHKPSTISSSSGAMNGFVPLPR